jgi:hypothetical protein
MLRNELQDLRRYTLYTHNRFWMSLQQIGHLCNFVEHSLQTAICPQGMNATQAVFSIQTLHSSVGTGATFCVASGYSLSGSFTVLGLTASYLLH